MAAAATSPRISDEEMPELLALIHDSDSVELKLTVPESDQRSAVEALGHGPARGADPPGVLLRHARPRAATRRAWSCARGACSARATTRSSSCGRSSRRSSPASVRRTAGFGVEVDAMPGGFVCSGSMKAAVAPGARQGAVAGQRPLRKLFSKEQRAFYAAHAPAERRARRPHHARPDLRAQAASSGPRASTARWSPRCGSTRTTRASSSCPPSARRPTPSRSPRRRGRSSRQRGVDLSGEQQTKTKKALDVLQRAGATSVLMAPAGYGEQVTWQPAAPRVRPLRLARGVGRDRRVGRGRRRIVPGVSLERPGRGLLVAAVASRSSTRSCRRSSPPCGCRSCSRSASCSCCSPTRRAAAGRRDLPRTGCASTSFGDALLLSLVIAAVGIVLQVHLRHQRRRRVHAAASRAGSRAGRARSPAPTRPGSSSSRSTGCRCRCCAARSATGTCPTMARWIADHGYHLAEWETDLSSQTGASQAGILLGSNEDIPAFRWVEKETGTMMVCSSAGRLRGDRAPALDRHRPAHRRRREPRQPALRRGRSGDPHRQPHGRREAGEPRLPRLPGERLQRHPRCSSSTSGKSCWSGRRPRARSAATCARAGTAAAAIRSCAARCACSSAT